MCGISSSTSAWPTGPLLARVGEDVMAEPAVGVEDDPDHLDAGHVPRLALPPTEGAEVIAAEAGDLVDDRVLAFRFLRERRRQHDSGAHRASACRGTS